MSTSGYSMKWVLKLSILLITLVVEMFFRVLQLVGRDSSSIILMVESLFKVSKSPAHTYQQC